MIQEVRETTEQENTLNSDEEAIALAVATDTTESLAKEVEEEETRVLEQPFRMNWKLWKWLRLITPKLQ